MRRIKLGMSELMKDYVAGQLVVFPYPADVRAHHQQLLKRLVEGAWAPPALHWSVDHLPAWP